MTQKEFKTKLLIEQELYDYHKNLKKLESDSARMDIIESSGGSDESLVRGTDISDPTQNKAFQLLKTSRELKEMEKRVNAISRVIQIFRKL